MYMFDITVADCLTYTEWLEQHFALHDTQDEKEEPALLNYMGGKTYCLLCSLMPPDKQCTKMFGVLVTILRSILHRNPWRELSALNSISTISRKVKASLLRLVEHCVFGDASGQIVGYLLVYGIGDEATHKHVLTITALTFKRGVEKVISG